MYIELRAFMNDSEKGAFCHLNKANKREVICTYIALYMYIYSAQDATY